MMKSSMLLRSITILSLIAAVVLLFGFGYAVKEMLYPTVGAESDLEKLKPSVPAKQSTTVSLKLAKEIRIVALGDSLTKGTGDSTGAGYVKQVASGLEAEMDKPVRVLNNLAINGLQADELAEQLSGDNGFIRVLQQANLILLTIGGNDLFQSARAKQAGHSISSFRSLSLGEELRTSLGSFEQVIKELNRINPQARLVYVGLYNPFYDIKQLRGGSIEVQEWNKEVYTLIHDYPNMMMVPTFDLFEGKSMDYLSADHFHPNHEGYKQIAERIVKSLD